MKSSDVHSETTGRTPRIYTRVTDEAGVQQLWRKGERIGTVFRSEDRVGVFFAWNVFFNGRFGGSSQDNSRPPSLSAALTACRQWVKEREIVNG